MKNDYTVRVEVIKQDAKGKPTVVASHEVFVGQGEHAEKAGIAVAKLIAEETKLKLAKGGH